MRPAAGGTKVKSLKHSELTVKDTDLIKDTDVGSKQVTTQLP